MNKRYFFHIVGGGRTFEDEDGAVFSGPEAARLQAAVIAVELAQNTDFQGSMVYVVDDDSREVARVPIVNGTGGLKH